MSLLTGQTLELLLRDLVNLEVVSRQSCDLAGIGQHADGALANCYGFRFRITFPAGFEVRSAVPSSFLTEARRKPFQLFVTEVW